MSNAISWTRHSPGAAAAAEFIPCSVPNPATVGWPASIRERLVVGNRVRELVHETFGHAAHVLAGILLGQELVHLRRQVLRPKLQRLPLISRERLQDFGCTAAFGHDFRGTS